MRMTVRMPRMPWWVKAGACALLIIAVGATAAWSGGEAQAADYSATVVYFYPSDQEPNREYIAQMDDIMAGIQGWYGNQVGSTFSIDPVQVIQGQRKTAYYGQGGEIWGTVLTELRYYCGTGVHVIVLHQSIAFTGGGSCDSEYQSSSAGGTAMIAEDFWNPLEGVIAHELGHVFALPHSTCESVMWCWWGYPNVGLLDVEKQALASSPFFSAPIEGGNDDTPDSTPDGTSDGTSDGTGDGTGGEPDTVAPTVKIVSPSDSAVVRGRWLKVRAEGTDNVGVTKMELYIDSQLVFTTEAASLDHKWNMRGVAKGSSLTVTVKAFDEAGNSSVAEVSVTK